MDRWVPFWPKNAAVSASVVDRITIGEFALIALVLCFVFGMMITFCLRFRRGTAATRSEVGSTSWHYEIGWTSATLVGFLVLFVLGANAYLFLYSPPAHPDLELYVVGKQWMWKIQHTGGQREIDALHVPIGRSVRVVLASEDVVHSFYIPAFRLKHDAVPGQFEAFWFRATQIGQYRLECSEYCGTDHAHMLGTVNVLSQADYTRWLASQPLAQPLSERGAALMRQHGCTGCHGPTTTASAPTLQGLYGSVVHLQDGRDAVANEHYLRTALFDPQSQRVAGYPATMPSFAGQLSEEDLIAIIAYIRSSKVPSP